jgi:predicted RecB family nuclease
MRIYDNKTLFSATDLVTFLGCEHASGLDQLALTEKIEKTRDDDMHELLQKRGHEHERAYLKQLVEAGANVVEITGKRLEDRHAATVAAMREGATIIYQATLYDPPWHGHADFLRRMETPSTLGGYSYEVVDTKLSRHAKPSHIIQLCVYSELVRKVQGRAPHRMHIKLGDGHEQSFYLNDYHYYYHAAKARLEGFVATSPATEAEPCSACVMCHWRGRCEEQWKTSDHLSLVANISRGQIGKLHAFGVTTVKQLSELAPDTRVPKMLGTTLDRLRSQADLQVSARETGKRSYVHLPLEVGKGFGRMPPPDPGDIFFDIEGDPLYPDGLEYLWGVRFAVDGVMTSKAYWAHDHDAERGVVRELLGVFASIMSAHANAHIYHYGAYEVTALKKLTARYAVGEFELDQCLRQGRFVDLYQVVREGVRVSEPRYSIKNIERFYMAQREGDVASGSESIIAYEHWRESQDHKTLDEIKAYNFEDLLSTELLRQWLTEIRPGAAEWLAAPGVFQAPEVTEAHQAQQEARRQLVDRVLADSAGEERRYRELLVDLLDFYRRAAKPEWWALFERQGAEIDDLVEDAECLGGLVALEGEKPKQVKQSLVYRYRFPAQETKRRLGDQCTNTVTAETIGKIVELNEETGIVGISRSAKREALPTDLSIGPPTPFDNRQLAAAVGNYVAKVADGAVDVCAISDLLRRRPPRVNGKVSGEPLISDETHLLEQATDVIARLDHSYLFIQGPPGAGKTYTSAHIIRELLRQGKRVGVSSMSHKAINNLLHAIEKAAQERGVTFRGAKKSDASQEETQLNGQMIEDVFENEMVGDDHQLVGGTAWLFSRAAFDNQFDYLFVDEAGQVSLANIVAMSQCARNLVLVGDQMQLGQPIQGVHPGESGLSVLDYLLQSQTTVAPDRGIFLPMTWRMHEKICQLISDAVYDGRLRSLAETSNQRIEARIDWKIPLPEAGLMFFPLTHSGCSQRSEAEADLILQLVNQLLGASFIDRDRNRQTLGLSNIIVVAPYNVQVNYLKAVLPLGVRVGTVDKFQGQEAEVVLVSMVTSSAEDMPRNVEFLLSKNRINVAISRAKTLACVVASDRLLSIPCNSIDQLSLANTLCWARAYCDASPFDGAAATVQDNDADTAAISPETAMV